MLNRFKGLKKKGQTRALQKTALRKKKWRSQKKRKKGVQGHFFVVEKKCQETNVKSAKRRNLM